MKKLYYLLSIGFVAFLTIQFPHAMINPGELVAGHQKQNNQCLSCHKPFGGIANEKCISCHKLSEIGKDTSGNQNKTLFHQHLSKQECTSCHTDHQGLSPENALRGFKHELLSAFIINDCKSCHNKPGDNLHLQISSSCNSCHETKSWENIISFDHGAILNHTDCASCHQKPKDTFHLSVQGNCDKCHSTDKWAPSTFDHSAYFVLDQNHNVTCATCHTKNSYPAYTCFGCHAHSERNIIAEHTEEGIYNISNCASCHKSSNEEGTLQNNESMDEGEINKLKNYIRSNEREEDND